MARRGRGDVGQAFRNDPQLQQFVLNDVTPTGRVLGTGSYGAVEEVSYKHLVCAGKKLHETLIAVENDGVDNVIRKYLEECQLMSSLRHPNITQFLGLCFLPDTRLPLLVMECLETSLDDLLEHMPNLPLSLKRSILEDVARGLLYLHERQPPVIHRDLTSKNVLLTSHFVAKITDMGNSRIVTMSPGQMAKTLTKYPGTLVYMPPEAQTDIHRYGASMDIFSFGHLALYAITQKFPGDLLPSTYINSENDQEVKARSEVERRGVYIELLETHIGSFHPALVQLVKQCLHNDPRQRPSTEELLTRLQGMRVEVEGPYGMDIAPLDLAKVRMAKTLQEKNKKIEDLTQQQARREEEFEERIGEMTQQQARREEEFEEELTQQQARHEMELETRLTQQQVRHEAELRGQTEQFIQQLARRARREVEFQEQIEQLTQQKVEQKVELEDMMRSMRETVRELEESQEKEAGQRRELETLTREIARLRKKEHLCSEQVELKLPLKLTWKDGPDMPYVMSGYIQSVLIIGKLYVGGGQEYSISEDYTVMEYDIALRKWNKLQQYQAHFFAMATVNNQLVLVGGYNRYRGCSKMLGVWDAYDKTWTHPYLEMPTARSDASVVAYKEWLVVAGGRRHEGHGGRSLSLSRVEVLNTGNNQWYTGPPTPSPWHHMKTTLIGDQAYFMGGYLLGPPGISVYQLDLHTLISSITSHVPSKKSDQQLIWKEATPLQLNESSPLAIGGSLLVFGGYDQTATVSTAIHLLTPESGWVKVGDLPFPRSGATCAMTSDREILVTGGYDEHRLSQKTVHLALIT